MDSIGGYSWANVVKGNQLTAKVNPLTFAPTVTNGKNVAHLDKLEVDKLSAIWANSIVIYVGEMSSIGLCCTEVCH